MCVSSGLNSIVSRSDPMLGDLATTRVLAVAFLHHRRRRRCIIAHHIMSNLVLAKWKMVPVACKAALLSELREAVQ
jgi:hypothetical protein